MEIMGSKFAAFYNHKVSQKNILLRKNYYPGCLNNNICKKVLKNLFRFMKIYIYITETFNDYRKISLGIWHVHTQ